MLLGAALAGFQLAALIEAAAAAVYSAQRAFPPQTIQLFLAQPAALLEQYPSGGGQMISRVRDLAASDPSTLDAIVGLLATANADQSTAIGIGLGQVALMAVKIDQAYANQIQEAIAGAVKAYDVDIVETGGSKIGSAVKTIDQVEGVTEKGPGPIAPGSTVYQNELVRTGRSGQAELLFADRTNLAVGPVSAIRLDKFVYDPSGGSGSVVVEVTEGTFRFITGSQPSGNYVIKTPTAALGVRGTEFIVAIRLDGEAIQLLKGAVTVRTISGERVQLNEPCKVLLIDVQGNPRDGGCVSKPIADFADLGEPTTNTTLANALAAFNATTGNTAIGAAGPAGGGGGGGGGGTSGTGSFGNTANLGTTPNNSVTPTLPSLTGGTSGSLTKTSLSPF